MPSTLPLFLGEPVLKPETYKALDAFCRPVREARGGDILGIVLDGKLDNNAVSLFPITDYAVMDEQGPVQRCYTDLPDIRKADIACATMDIQCSGFCMAALLDIVRRLDPENGEALYFQALLLPGLLILVTDDYYDTLLYDLDFGEGRQDLVDANLLMAITDPVTSSHELLARHPDIEAGLEIANALYPVPDLDGADEDATEPLILPELARLIADGYA